MKKKDLKKYAFGSAGYVVMHAKWKKGRGKKNPSTSFGFEKNPRKALLFATILCKSSVPEYCPGSENPVLKAKEEVDFTLEGLIILASLLNESKNQSNIKTPKKETIPSRFPGRVRQFLDGTGDW